MVTFNNRIKENKKLCQIHFTGGFFKIPVPLQTLGIVKDGEKGRAQLGAPAGWDFKLPIKNSSN